MLKSSRFESFPSCLTFLETFVDIRWFWFSDHFSVAEVSRALRLLTQSLFPSFQLAVFPLPGASWTATRLLAGVDLGVFSGEEVLSWDMRHNLLKKKKTEEETVLCPCLQVWNRDRESGFASVCRCVFDCSWCPGHLSHGCGDRCTTCSTDRILCAQLLSKAAILDNRLHAALRWSGSVFGVWQLVICPEEGGRKGGRDKGSDFGTILQLDSTTRISIPTVLVHQSNPAQTKVTRGSNKISYWYLLDLTCSLLIGGFDLSCLIHIHQTEAKASCMHTATTLQVLQPMRMMPARPLRVGHQVMYIHVWGTLKIARLANPKDPKVWSNSGHLRTS